MNLENLNVQELDTEEMKSNNGGFWWGAIVGGMAYDAFKWGFSDMEGHGGWLQGGQFRGGGK